MGLHYTVYHGHLSSHGSAVRCATETGSLDLSRTACTGPIWHRRKLRFVSVSWSVRIGPGRGRKPGLDVCGVPNDAIGPAAPKMDRNVGTRCHGFRHVARCMGRRDHCFPLERRPCRRTHLQRCPTVAPDRTRRLRIRNELDLWFRSDVAARTAARWLDTRLGD